MQFQTYRGLLSAKECIHRLSSHKNIDSMTHPISDARFSLWSTLMRCPIWQWSLGLKSCPPLSLPVFRPSSPSPRLGCFIHLYAQQHSSFRPKSVLECSSSPLSWISSLHAPITAFLHCAELTPGMTLLLNLLWGWTKFILFTTGPPRQKEIARALNIRLLWWLNELMCTDTLGSYLHRISKK